ncbi:hypothetical protein MNV49_004133 [Pseudohyphozyma bogoriensis]|nr:hypothetical protein MNV49_004133 [Pseudohyphozyma bogoriensis]
MLQDWARGVGTVGAGLTTGLMLSQTLWTYPAIFSAQTLAPRDRLHLWSKLYDKGAFTNAVLLTPLSTVCLLIAAYLARAPPSYLAANLVARNRRAVLALSALAVFATTPYTMALMMGPITQLKQTEQAIIKDAENYNGAVETDTLIQRWLSLHRGRIVLAGTGFVLAVAELVCV